MKLKLRIKTALKCNKTLITTQIAFLAAATVSAQLMARSGRRNRNISISKKRSYEQPWETLDPRPDLDLNK